MNQKVVEIRKLSSSRSLKYFETDHKDDYYIDHIKRDIVNELCHRIEDILIKEIQFHENLNLLLGSKEIIGILEFPIQLNNDLEIAKNKIDKIKLNFETRFKELSESENLIDKLILKYIKENIFNNMD